MAGDQNHHALTPVGEKSYETKSVSPYSLYASDNPEAMITYVQLTEENHNE